MKKICFLLCIISSLLSASEIDLDSLCQKAINFSSNLEDDHAFAFIGTNHGEEVLFNHGLCQRYEENINKNKTSYRSDSWKFNFYFSHAFTHYFKNDITFNSSRYQVLVKDYQWDERHSRQYYLPATWAREGNNPFQWIDEPTNTFVISMEKDNNEIFVSLFHPKYLQNNDQINYMTGTIDGVEVDGYKSVQEPFPGWVNNIGDMRLIRNENTHLQMEFAVGYGRKIDIFKSDSIGNFTLTPGISIALMTGRTFVVIAKPGTWWQYEDYTDKYGVQGFGGNLHTKLEWSLPKEQFGIFFEGKIGIYSMEHGFINDGTQSYNLKYASGNVGVKISLWNPENHKMSYPNVTNSKKHIRKRNRKFKRKKFFDLFRK